MIFAAFGVVAFYSLVMFFALACLADEVLSRRFFDTICSWSTTRGSDFLVKNLLHSYRTSCGNRARAIRWREVGVRLLPRPRIITV